MTNEELIQKIKAEIEQRRNSYIKMHGKYGRDADYIAATEDLRLLEFLDTLESEKPIEGLEEEIQSFWNRASGFQPKFATLEVKENGFAVIARHFAQWGAEHLKK